MDLTAIYGAYQGEKGQPPFSPAMMVALLLYSYLRDKPRRIGRNPTTREEVLIPSRRVVAFKASNSLSKRVNDSLENGQ